MIELTANFLSDENWFISIFAGCEEVCVVQRTKFYSFDDRSHFPDGSLVSSFQQQRRTSFLLALHQQYLMKIATVFFRILPYPDFVRANCVNNLPSTFPKTYLTVIYKWSNINSSFNFFKSSSQLNERGTFNKTHQPIIETPPSIQGGNYYDCLFHICIKYMVSNFVTPDNVFLNSTFHVPF